MYDFPVEYGQFGVNPSYGQYGQFTVDYEQRPYDPQRMREYRWNRMQEMLRSGALAP